jgi:plasmid stabilization system protein ParE
MTGIETAERFLLNADKSFGDLSRHPEMGAPLALRSPKLAGLRKWVVSGFENVLIFYLPYPGGVSIVRAWHGRAGLVALSWNPMSTKLIPSPAPGQCSLWRCSRRRRRPPSASWNSSPRRSTTTTRARRI